MVVHLMDGESQTKASSSSRKKRNTKPSKRLSVDDRYIRSGVWKCKDSPTGAHHWKQDVDPESKLTLDEMPFICKYCRGVKYMESFYTYSRWAGWNHSRDDEEEDKHQASVRKSKKATSHATSSKFTRNPDNIMTKGKLRDSYLK